MLKPLLRTIILASILFFLLVYLGIKYHWGDAIKKIISNQQTQIELKIPKVEEPKVNPTIINHKVDEVGEGAGLPENINIFQPEIIKNTPATSVVDAMTKDQIALQCQQLYYQVLGMDEDINAELLIGNCVVSNYQEPFENSIKTPQIIQNEQHLKVKAINTCRQKLLRPENESFSGIEIQLLIGVCVSNQMTQ